MANQIREALEAAYTKRSAAATEEEERRPEEDTSEPVRTAPEETSEEPAATVEPEKPVDEPSEPEKPAEEVVAESGEAPAEPSGETKPKTESPRAPQSWRPGVREHWSKLPAEVQAEVTKRELEVNQALTRSANARRLEQEFYSVVAPFEGIIRSQNSTPMQAVSNLMQTSARLHLGTPAQKAQVAVEIIRNFGIDIQMLDAMLAGQTPPPEEDRLARLLDQRLAPVQQFMQRVSSNVQQREQQTQAEVQAEIDAFSSREFFADVRETMADLMELAARRNRDMTLEEAYNQAIAMTPELNAIVTQRRAAQSSQHSQQELRRKKDAASSVSGGPAQQGAKAPESIRGAIEQAWGQASGR